MTLVFANLCAANLSKNSWFSTGHRDNCTFPFWLLRQKFLEIDVELNTPDMNMNNKVLFEIHIDRQKINKDIPAYLFLWETRQVNPENNICGGDFGYRKIFTWNDVLVKEYDYKKFFLPIPPDECNFTLGWLGRDKLCCAIAGNKSINVIDSGELYTERVRTFKWFELNAANDFDLFGAGWESFPPWPGRAGKVFSEFIKPLVGISRFRPFPSHRGTVKSKKETLSKYKFSICYENVGGLPGYITEKIFDCFFAGCIPIYWGAKNIHKYIPSTCFIDRSSFNSHEDLYKFIKDMPESQYISYQLAIKEFLSSEAAFLFSSEFFASFVIELISKDLSLTK